MTEQEQFKKALHEIEGTNYNFVMSGLHWWCILTHLQSALHHPQAVGFTSKVTREVVGKIAALVADKGILKDLYEREQTEGPRVPEASGRPQLGETGDGELKFAIAADKSEGVVRIDFGMKVRTLAMSPKDCRHVIEVLEKSVEMVEKAVV